MNIRRHLQMNPRNEAPMNIRKAPTNESGGNEAPTNEAPTNEAPGNEAPTNEHLQMNPVK